MSKKKHKSEYVSNFDIKSEKKKKSFGENQKKLSVNLFIFVFLSKGTKKTTYNDIATRTDTLTICWI